MGWWSRPSDDDADREAEARAWTIYHSHGEWISRVDAKASIMLALQGVTLGAVIALTDKDRPYAQLCWWWEWALFIAGFAMLLAAIVLAVLALVPRVTSEKPSKKEMRDYIYFGHTRLWKPDALEDELRKPALPVLARQLIVLGRISWRKHYLVKYSVWCYIISGALLTATALIVNFWG